MNNKMPVEKMIEETLNCLDGTGRAEPKPFLLTRINARLSKHKTSVWEMATQFFVRPSVVIAGLGILIGINALVVAVNKQETPATAVADQLASTSDEFSTTTATLYDIDNIEP